MACLLLKMTCLLTNNGFCADEFQDNGHLPYQLYVRISNRLVGDYVMTQVEDDATGASAGASAGGDDVAAVVVVMMLLQLLVVVLLLVLVLLTARGNYVMTQFNIGNPRGKSDSIGVADWSYDEHMTGKVSLNNHA